VDAAPTLRTPSRWWLKRIECLVDVVEAEVVRHERRQIDAAMFDHRHQPAHPLLAARAQRRHDLLIAEAGIERLVRRDELARVDAEAGERSARANRPQRVLERLLQTQRFDRDVDAAAVRQPLDVGKRIAVL
jgi:hypothetical protein